MLLQDRVQSYFGMRKISLGTVPGESNPRIMLNNMFLFQMGVLDQVSTCAHKPMYDVWRWFGLAFFLLDERTHMMCCGERAWYPHRQITSSSSMIL